MTDITQEEQSLLFFCFETNELFPKYERKLTTPSSCSTTCTLDDGILDSETLIAFQTENTNFFYHFLNRKYKCTQICSSYQGLHIIYKRHTDSNSLRTVTSIIIYKKHTHITLLICINSLSVTSANTTTIIKIIIFDVLNKWIINPAWKLSHIKLAEKILKYLLTILTDSLKTNY